jgi:hypothetical protein
VSGSGMIAARPEGLAVDFDGQSEGCVSGWDAVLPAGCVTIDDKSDPGSWARVIAEREVNVSTTPTDVFNRAMTVVAEACRRNHALGIICHAAAKCTDVQKLADSGRIDRDGADLFIRRYSESIAEIVAELVPPASSSKGN